ncbi:hypothetical protein J5N97_023582 [Dioscorea zingiberensis]|uniref:C2H2-type domain-containing protein n=1 Tax=Dioscorea zingiberensis TaxID=325984 RepID=A0A9D5C543_9LILI|nr:hypothetical protein J5N97_023582 [Dioscorea zingiberensis]
MSVAKVRAFSSTDAMNTEQKIGRAEKESHDSFENILKNPMKDPFLPLSRDGDSSVQWIQLLHALDQQGSSRMSKDSKVDNCGQGKEQSLDLCSGFESSVLGGVKESSHSLKGYGSPAKGMKSTSEPIQSLKFPDAVVAFAQAAAKANGEPEKYLPGWPLLSPSKVQLQKCDKCSREFCSTINYRRHIRVHRRSLNIDKDSSKSRELLGEFWSKLSPDEAKEIFSLNDVAIEEVTGPSILRSLASLIRMPAFSSLPHTYVKAGATLLDIVQARSSRIPMSSQELFSVLDDASEKTFMCAGTATSMQKFVFDGEAGKIALEMKNLVACTSFLLEQKLVKAWLADKDAEALRCQKLLVEEEEAAQKRQAELLERKRLKKLRQKVQKAKETVDSDKLNLESSSSDAVDSTSGSAETPSPRGSSEPDLDNLAVTVPLLLESVGSSTSSTSDMELNKSLKQPSQVSDQAVNKKQLGSGRWQPISLCHQTAKPIKNISSGFHPTLVAASKSSVAMKHGNNYRDLKTVPPANCHKIWARKTKHENEDEGSYVRDGEEKKHRCHQYQPALSDNHEVLIGSISVTLKDGDCHCQDGTTLKQTDSLEKVGKPNLITVNPSKVKLWRPVSHHGNGDAVVPQSEKRETEMDHVPAGISSMVSSDKICQGTDVFDANIGCKDSARVDAVEDLPGPRLFSSDSVKAFLAQRWKEAIASDHVMLILDSENETAGCLDATEDCCNPSPNQALAAFGRSILGSAENRMAADSVAVPSSGASKTKFRAKPEKNYKVKYVPKQKNNSPEG